MFGKAETNKNIFLEEKQKNRTNRLKQIEDEKRRDDAILIIQRIVRGWLARIKFKRKLLENFDEFFPNTTNAEEIELRPCLQVYQAASHFLLQWKDNDVSVDNRNRLERLCRYLRTSIDSESPKLSYVAVALNKDHSLFWIKHMKKLLYKCCVVLEQLKPEIHNDSLRLALILHTLVAYTSPNSWAILKSKQLSGLKPGMQQLCNNILGDLIQKGFFLTLRTILIKGTCTRSVVTLKPISLTAVMTLALRPLIYGNFTQNLLNMFVCQILSTPAICYQLEQISPDTLTKFHTHSVFEKCIELLYDKESFKFVANSQQGTKLLSLTANLIHLYSMESMEKAMELAYPMFTNIMKSLFETIPDTVEQRGACTQWHELLGWFTPNAKENVYENLSLIKRQVNLLWNNKLIKILLGDELKQISSTFEKIEPVPIVQPATTSSSTTTNSLFKKAIECRNNLKSGIINKNNKSNYRKFDNQEVQRVANTCAMFYEALKTLPQLKLDILSGICYNGTVLHDLWLLIQNLGPNCGLKNFLEYFKNEDNKNPGAPGLLLLLFCDCMTHYVTILDDMEMYEQQNPFTLSDYIVLSSFLNNLLYKTVYDNLIEPKVVFTCPLYVSMHTLLLCLFRRDCRRPFAERNHWLIKDVKPSYFLIDLEKGKKHIQLLLQKMPHIIPHEDRVQLFRKFVQNEKSVLGLTDSAYSPQPSSALVTVHRNQIVEDGYRQLAALPARALKGCIRVRFINQQGLDEAGIDQDGVFKEFLEETIKKVFDPSLNLFKTTSENRLYPSSTSYLQENHLQLFEFVGRMLGKAVYEGIVVDVPFASFFLSLVLGQTQQALYSCMDELPSLDKELYKSLTFIKHYEGDVADLDLTFSVDEDVMGKIVTHELFPGGRLQPVTNDNKINYIHSMAFFRMHTQICEQTSAFIRGFRSIINPDWLSLFSTPELQRLISGDTSPLDLKDLRRNTQYYGGFHDSHRVVTWLWDILAKDFTEDERRLFLKFVTSCSKPPLLGFANLEPPFSIRCVEVGDDEDTGDTIGSVIRGFFTIRKKEPLNRLPTSSTCFNLLKLPNYQKKSTLREKLKYAISSNTGFELS